MPISQIDETNPRLYPDPVDGGLRGVSKEEQNNMKPSDALVALLTQAQEDHRKCLQEARMEGKNIVDACALSWGNVWVRYRQWAAYRAPFKDEEAIQKWEKVWKKKPKEQD